MEYNDIYDENRNLTGRLHRRGTRWKQGEYGLIVCVWVYDGKGKILLTQRAPEKNSKNILPKPSRSSAEKVLNTAISEMALWPP